MAIQSQSGGDPKLSRLDAAFLRVYDGIRSGVSNFTERYLSNLLVGRNELEVLRIVERYGGYHVGKFSEFPPNYIPMQIKVRESVDGRPQQLLFAFPSKSQAERSMKEMQENIGPMVLEVEYGATQLPPRSAGASPR